MNKDNKIRVGDVTASARQLYDQLALEHQQAPNFPITPGLRRDLLDTLGALLVQVEVQEERLTRVEQALGIKPESSEAP